jgi:hypothetical protein
MMLWLWCAVALQNPAAPPSAGDEGTLVLREDTSVVGHEAFAIVGLTANGAPNGWRLGTRARYGMGSRSLTLAPVVELGPDTEPVSLQYDVSDPANPLRILGQATRGGGRFTLRYLSPDRERTRELRVGPRSIVVDDSALALYLIAAWRARSTPASVSALFARTMRQESLTLVDLGSDTTTVNRQSTRLRHITIAGGAAKLVHVWLDPAGRLMKVAIPSRHLVGERSPAS